jgi:hypothetical protein
MKKLVVKVMVASAVATGGVLAVAAPAQAGYWSNGGVYSSYSNCDRVGNARVSSGRYQTYTCESQSPGYKLWGYIN